MTSTDIIIHNGVPQGIILRFYTVFVLYKLYCKSNKTCFKIKLFVDETMIFIIGLIRLD